VSFPEWSLLIGLLLLSIMLTGTFLGRLPLSPAMVYLVIGAGLGAGGANVLRLDLFRDAALLASLAEIALLISLFAVGLKLGVPLRDRRWRLPARLAFLSMAFMVGIITAVGVMWLDLPLGAAVLLGAILAPTDPVLASGVQAEPGSRPDRVGFSLAGEGGLNDGAAYPFVMLGLGLMGMHGLGSWLVHWWAVDLIWATLAGLAIGAALGTAIGKFVVHLRSRHGEAEGLNQFLSLGLLATAYGTAQLCLASGFLAVFAAGIALQRVREAPNAGEASSGGELPFSATMRDSVQDFNEQLEKLAELTLVLIVGALLSATKPIAAIWWFVPMLLVVARPLSTLVATVGEQATPPQRAMIGWFGIRGIGSVFYLLLAVRLGVKGELAETISSLTLWTVAASIVAHGITAQPLMRRYLVRARRRHR
jgi:NhaP-type Na+/H+ or K+/H+ antiporter